ncbi:MAG: hypothetical protein HOV81_09575 [Kofleriaceae bacterium]|nr:hypothetical protein [Kofleriaceae bacterium]
MVVAVVAVLVVKVTADEVVDVIAMRHLGVTAVGRMDVSGNVPATCVRWCATAGVLCVDSDLAFVDVAVVLVVQVAIVQVVDVTIVFDCDMPAVRPVRVLVILVRLMLGHDVHSIIEIGASMN